MARHVPLGVNRAPRNLSSFICLGLPALSFVFVFAALAAATANDDPDNILLGLARSLTRDVPEDTTRAGLPAMARLIQQSTGIDCKIPDPAAADELAERLAKDQLQLAVFQGIEFAWECARRPELRPLVTIVNHVRDRQALLVVRGDSTAGGWNDLKNLVLALPKRSREHCHLFLARGCRACEKAPEHFFSRLTAPATVEDALDDLADGAVGAALVDRAGLASYERLKPGRFGKLKILATSERFPDSVVAYRAGALSEATLQRFRKGLLQANQSFVGRHMLALWMATAFELPPADYDKLSAEIAKAYPSPRTSVGK
jgi:ABC-type phosphate/phosphonate transport system substrate-binding protein